MAVSTYNPKKVSIALGNHIVTGLAEDSFVTIEPSAEGFTAKVGCDGEVVRSVSPDQSYAVRVSVLQYSPTNKYLLERYEADMEEGNGLFPITVKDVLGKTVFTSEAAWVKKIPSMGYGKESGNREWELMCGEGHFTQG